jgi:lipid-binding SYLF domain-containing protein
MSKLFVRCVLLLVFVFGAIPAFADWEADPDNEMQVKAAKAIVALREKHPGSEKYFEDAYGFAILPGVTRFAVGFGGAYGKGMVIEGDAAIGTTKFWQFSSGIQAGINHFSMIIFFKDKEALDYYKSEELQFMGQAGVAAGTLGAASTPSYNDGVAIVTVTRLGLMFEFSYSGARFTYKPLPK